MGRKGVLARRDARRRTAIEERALNLYPYPNVERFWGSLRGLFSKVPSVGFGAKPRNSEWASYAEQEDAELSRDAL